GPPGGRQRARELQRNAFLAQCQRQPHWPALARGDAFADRVAVAEGEVGEGGGIGGHGQLRWTRGCAVCQATAVRAPVDDSTRRASTRSMRANTSRSSSGCGSRVTRKWLR